MTGIAMSSDYYACAKGIRAVNEVKSDRTIPPVRYSATSSMNRRNRLVPSGLPDRKSRE